MSVEGVVAIGLAVALVAQEVAHRSERTQLLDRLMAKNLTEYRIDEARPSDKDGRGLFKRRVEEAMRAGVSEERGDRQ